MRPRIQALEKETQEELKVKKLIILDLSKKFSETNSRLKEFSALYDVVKNERNKYVNLIQASSQALAEMKEKIKNPSLYMQKKHDRLLK